MNTMATRIGSPWTKEEEDAILAHVASGMRIPEIAIAQKRTSGGIRSRLTRIACQLVEQKMSVYEASGRTGIRAARIQEVLARKTEEAKTECLNPKMQFTFTTTTSREELRALPMKNKIARLQSLVDDVARTVGAHASRGDTQYIWESQEIERVMSMHGQTVRFTPDEFVQALRARFPGCKVERVEEWVDVPNRQMGQPPTRVLKSGIKIDWA